MAYRENWDEIKSLYTAWWRHELDYPLLQVTSPASGAPPDGSFDWWIFLEHKDDPSALKKYLERYPNSFFFGGEAFPSAFPNLGPGVLASYFSGYLEYNNETRTTWFEQAHSRDEVEAMTFTGDTPWWRYTQAITRLCVEMGKDRYMTGMTDIGGILDVLASIRGAENLLMDLIEAPDHVHRMRARIIEAWHRVYDDLARMIAESQEGVSSWLGLWAPTDYYPLQCDFCAMISPAMFEVFVAPDVQEQCRRLGHGIYHLDGPGQIPHLELLLDIPELDGIQWVPGSGNPACDDPVWFPMYRRILERGKSLVLQGFDNPWNIPSMIEALPQAGLLFSACFGKEADARDFLKAVRP